MNNTSQKLARGKITGIPMNLFWVSMDAYERYVAHRHNHTGNPPSIRAYHPTEMSVAVNWRQYCAIAGRSRND